MTDRLSPTDEALHEALMPHMDVKLLTTRSIYRKFPDEVVKP